MNNSNGIKLDVEINTDQFDNKLKKIRCLLNGITYCIDKYLEDREPCVKP